jgi:hypothetical protein
LQTIGEGVDVMQQTAQFLADLPAAWEAATPELRNELARVLFEDVVIQNDRVESVTPRPEFQPFFVLDYVERLDSRIKRKRRDSNPRSRP